MADNITLDFTECADCFECTDRSFMFPVSRVSFAASSPGIERAKSRFERALDGTGPKIKPVVVKRISNKKGWVPVGQESIDTLSLARTRKWDQIPAVQHG